MTTGAGRFASGALSALVQAFFDGGNTIPAGTYTKVELAQYLGIASYGITFQAYEFADGTDDIVERTYVFNSQAFKLSDGRAAYWKFWAVRNRHK